MIRDTLVIAGKDLAIERSSRVGVNQVIPFSLVIVLLFGFALNTQSRIIRTFAPGLFWVAIVFASLYLITRSMGLERDNAAIDGLLMLGVNPISIFFGKLIAICVMMLLLEIVEAGAIIVLFSVDFHSLALICISAVIATVGIGAVGLVYGGLASDQRSGDSLVPLLVLPVLAPIIIGATNCWSDALLGHISIGDPWLVVLSVFGVVFLSVGASSFGAILED